MDTPDTRPWRHAVYVAGAFALVFGWLFAQSFLRHAYVADSDLYEYFLPQFLSPITVWSAFEFGGMPAFADPGDASLYPVQLLFRLLGSWTALIIAVYAIAGCCAYAYVYSLTRSRTAAAFSGLAYALSEAMMERLPHFGLLNTIAWFPLILLAVDRLRTPRPWRWIAIGALALAVCFLAGNPQVFLYFGSVCALYAVAGGLAERASWRYYVALPAMATLGGLLTLVKTLPMLEASLYTARQTVGYDAFAGHANTPAQMLTIVFPTILHEGREAPTYVGLLTLLFALVAVSRLFRNWRVLFWVIVTIGVLLVGVGDATPVQRLLFELPAYDRFRVAARHLVFAALGFTTLAGIGVAAVQRGEVSRRIAWAAGVVMMLALVAGAMTMTHWPSAFSFDERPGLPWQLPLWRGDIWTQLLIMLAAVIAAAGFASKRAVRVWTGALLLVVGLDLVYALPYSMTLAGLELPLISAEAAREPSVHARRLADAAAPLHQRLLAPDGTHLDAVAPALFARRWEIPIAGGYGPMLLARYGELARMGTNGSVEPTLMSHHDAALDLMAVKYVFVHAEDFDIGETLERHGITWASTPLSLPVGPQECGQQYPRGSTYALPAEITVHSIALSTHLVCAENARQGAPVATIKVIDASGGVYEQSLRAGTDVADERLKDPTLLARAAHDLGTVFDPSDDRYSYVTRIDLPVPVRGGRLEILVGGEMGGGLMIDRMTAIDDGGRFVPQTIAGALLGDTGRWRPAGRFETSRFTDRRRDESRPGEQPYVAFENRRALARAWLAGEVLPVTDRERDIAVHYSLLPDGRRFNPAFTALVEPEPEPGSRSGSEPGLNLERGPGPTSETAAGRGTAQATDGGSATVRSIGDGRIRVAVTSPGGGFLVLSESFYPGWQASIDGTTTAIVLTDGALQGVRVPAGEHIVDFVFASPTLRRGAQLSLLGLAVVGLILWRSGRGTARMPE